MKKPGWLLCCLIQVGLFEASAQTPSFVKTSEGVIVYTNPADPGRAKAVRLQVVTDKIIRVTAVPGKEFPAVESLVAKYPKTTGTAWEVRASKDSVLLKTASVKASVHLQSGNVSFWDATGKRIVAEKESTTPAFIPAVFEGQRAYQLTRAFQTTAGDAWYGLGQHQEDIFNYRGKQVQLFQNNTEVAVPFLISAKNYGILWDNYSLTRVGDVRPFHPLSSLQLYSRNGEAGWLTASYSNNKDRPGEVAWERAESEISMEFLGESKIVLPPSFTPASGLVKWEGSLSSELNGLHHLKLVFGGTIRLWLGDQLVLDRWRKAWNPAPALVPVQLAKGQKLPIRIDWIPEGSESYLSLKWQEPPGQEEQNSFAFQSEAGKQSDYYFIHGRDMDEVIAGYRKVSGKAPIVPKWALGFWQSRERYKTEAEILATVQEFRKRKIPLDNIVLDWSYWKENAWGSQDFDETRFPDPAALIDTLHKKYHTRFMISVWPKFYEGIPAYKNFNEKGWLYKRNVADRQRDWIGQGYVSTFYDAFNEQARKGFWDLIHKKIYAKGIDAWWMDASEPDILSNVSPQKRKDQMKGVSIGTAAEYLNAYPLQNAKGIYEGQRSVDTNKRVFLLTRSGFAGSQRYAATIWSGDIGSTWHDLKAQIPAGINFSMSGLPYWTMDIGGFVVESRFEKPGEKDLEEWRELQTRWFQFGAFVPIFRAHGQYPYREIFNIAPDTHPAYKSMLYYNQLRYRLLPYLYSLAGNAYHKDASIMRGLVMDFAKDTAVLNIGDQFLLGPSLLVNPVYTYGERKKELYLPKGQGWYDFYTGEWQAGGKKMMADAPFERMPLFVKEGSIIPFGPELQYTDEKPADTISLFVYTGKNAAFALYEDGGTSYDYETGKFSTIQLDYEEQTKTLTIGARQGSFTGMLQRRVFRVIPVTKERAQKLDFGTAAKEVQYAGQRVVIRL